MNHRNPCVSVIVPVYNVESYLSECLDSIMEQTLQEIEVVCVDDGSTDTSAYILSDYVKKYPQIKVINQENQGSGPARNHGMDTSTGKYIAFMDPDDRYPGRDTLNRLYQVAEAQDAMICGGSLILLEQGELRAPDELAFPSEGWLDYNDLQDCFWYTRFLYRADMLRKNSISFPLYRKFQDPPFLVRAMSCAKKLYTIPDAVYVYRIGYKAMCYSNREVVDLLRGIRETLRLAYLYDYRKMYEFRLKHTYETYLPGFCKYVLQRDIRVREVLCDIESIVAEWYGEIQSHIWKFDNILQYLTECANENRRFNKIITLGVSIIIYGSGFVGEYFLEHYVSCRESVLGFAQTRCDREEYKNGFHVKNLEYYLSWKKHAWVVVAVANKEQRMIMENHAKKLKFRHVISFSFEKTDIMELRDLTIDLPKRRCDKHG